MTADVLAAQEMLTALLMQPVANLAAVETNEGNQSDTCDITVADILGPLLEKEAGTSAEVADGSDRPRDANFSLLSYSFSLVSPAQQQSQTARMLSGIMQSYSIWGAGYAALGAVRGGPPLAQ